MLSFKFSYNGITINDSSTFNRRGISISDVSGISRPDVIHSSVDLVGQHGMVDYYSFIGKRLITLTGQIVGTDEDDCFTQIDAFTKAFNLPTIPDASDTGYRTLSWTKDGQSTYQIQAKIHSLPLITKTMKVKRKRTFHVAFRCQNPRIVSSGITTSNILKTYALYSLPMALPAPIGYDAGYSNEVIVTNDGNFGAEPTIIIYGPCENPKILNTVKTDLYQQFNITLADGEYITVDVINGTATHSDGSDALVYETDDSKSIQILSGDNTIRFETDDNSPTAYITISFRDTWMSSPR